MDMKAIKDRRANLPDEWNRHINALLFFGAPADLDISTTQEFVTLAPADIDALVKRVEKLEAALVRVVDETDARDHPTFYETGRTLCVYCQQKLQLTGYNERVTPQYAGHADYCAWVIARDALKAGKAAHEKVENTVS